MTQINISHAADLLGIGRQTVRKRAEAAGLASVPGTKGARLYESRELLPVALGLTGDKLDPAQERAKLDATRRQVAELQLAERRRELIPRPAVVDTWTRIIVVVRGRLLALPVRLASECGHRGPAEIQATAKRLVYEALTELANSDGLPPGNEPRPAPVEVLDPSTPRKASKRTRAQTVRG